MKHIISSFFEKLEENWRYLLPFSANLGYIGWLGHRNIGDEAMFIAFKKMFGEFNMLPFKYTEKIKLFEQINNGKIFKAVCLGGGTLVNHRGALKSLQIAKQNRYPTFVLGAGVRNPEFWDQKDRNENCLDEWVDFLETCLYVGVRGPLSKGILKNHNYHKAEITGDPALFLAGSGINQKKHIRRLGINIGISNGNVQGSEENILDFIVTFSKTMIKNGWQISFLSVWDKDTAYIEEAVRRINKNIPIFHGFNSLDRTFKFFNNCDLFIGEKLHSVILAMCTYTPSVMLEYRPKCLDFMMSMGLEKYNIRTDKLDLDLMVNLVTELYENIEYFQQKIQGKVNYYKNIQREKADIVKMKILKNNLCQK